MIQSRVQPNEVTYLGVLAACRHGGLVEKGWSIFQSMRSNHGVEPHQEHYFCMVDLLGQSGFIKEAVDLVSEMPFQPNRTIWSSLLAACVAHKNSELISCIAGNLRAAFPDDPSVYVMISNAYASLGMWDQLSRVRDAAKSSGIKESGKSWIEVM
ncbi:Pentatricopeptide repeat-containing protein At4g08210 [Linum perenne]